jgi:hypothetical protein
MLSQLKKMDLKVEALSQPVEEILTSWRKIPGQRIKNYGIVLLPRR